MAVRFKKKVGRPGVAMPKNPLGRRTARVLDRDYWQSVAETGNEMLKEGILIPVPYAHTDDNGVYPIPLLKGVNGGYLDANNPNGELPRWDLAANAGFAKKFEIDPEDGGLIVELEAEGDPNDQETHAGRIGKTFKQTSPFIGDFKDGSGKVWKNAPLHICLTNRAVQHGQSDFQLLTESGDPNQELIAKQGLTSPELAIAMAIGMEDYTDALAFAVGDDDSRTLASAIAGAGLTKEQVNKIKQLLEEKLRLKLPDDTSTENIGDRLVTVLTNMESQGDDLEAQLPVGSELLHQPVQMALNTGNTSGTGNTSPAGKAAPAAAAAPASNPDDLVVMERMKKQNQGLLAVAVKQKKDAVLAQLRRLVHAGKIGTKRAKEVLTPKIEGLAYSLDDLGEDGSLPQSPIELALAELEEEAGLIDAERLGDEDRPDGSDIADETDDMQPPKKTQELTKEEDDAHWERAGVPRVIG